MLHWQQHDAINTGHGAFNTIRVDCEQNDYTVYINDIEVADFTDDRHPCGYMGLSTSTGSSWEVDMECAFFNITSDYNQPQLFTHYNIFRNDELLGTTTDTNFESTLPEEGVYEYKVTAEFHEGVSDPTNGVSAVWTDPLTQTLVLDLDEAPGSGVGIAETLDEIGIHYAYATSWPSNLTQFKNIFLCTGRYPNDYTIYTSSSEEADLIEFLEEGGNLYYESDNGFSYAMAMNLYGYLNLEGTSDEYRDVESITGVQGQPTEGMAFEYSAALTSVDGLEPGPDATVWFNEVGVNLHTMLAYDAGDYHVISSTTEMGLLVDGENGTLAELLNLILDFFGYLSPPSNLSAENNYLGSVLLDWEVVNADDFMYFMVIRNGEFLDLAYDTSYHDQLTESGTYTYQVIAVYPYGSSQLSNEATVTWNEGATIYFNPVEPTEEMYPITVLSAFVGNQVLTGGHEIAVFDAGVCVGAYQLQNTWPIEIQAWKESSELPGYRDNHIISYVVWDGENEMFADAQYFSGNGAYGFGNETTVALNARVLHHQNEYLNNTNWPGDIVSANVHVLQGDIAEIFAPIAGSIEHVFELGSNNEWNPGNGINNIVRFDYRKAYRVVVSSPCTLPMEGTDLTFSDILFSLDRGADHWIGYSFTEEIDVEEAFTPIQDWIVLVQNLNSGIYWPSIGVCTISNLSTDDAYHIHLSDDPLNSHEKADLPRFPLSQQITELAYSTGCSLSLW